MAKNLKIISASPLVGSPITYMVQAETTNARAASHYVKLEVSAHFLNVDTEETVLTLSSPAQSGETLEFDVSSALRAVADHYEYTAEPPLAYPVISYSLRAWDEYMIDGKENKTAVTSIQCGNVLMGAYSDLERLKAGNNKMAQYFSRKPKTIPEMVAIGETVVIPQSFAQPMSEAIIKTGPTCKVYDVKTVGLQEFDGHPIYAVEDTSDRYQFRFINGLGVLESVSVQSYRQTEMNITSEMFIRSVQERFGKFSRGTQTKKNDYETFKLSSGPLDAAWQSWFMHEFLMASHVWMRIADMWLPVHITADEQVSGINRMDRNMLEVTFNVRLDINGSIDTNLLV